MSAAKELTARWQHELRATFDHYREEHPHVPPDQVYLWLIAELLRWVRDEHGRNADEYAELAAGYAEVFPLCGGTRDESEDEGR